MSQYDMLSEKYSFLASLEPVKQFVQYPSVLHYLGGLFEVKILDIGCGDGVVSRLLANKGAIVTGFDISNQQIKLAQKLSCSNKKINYFVSEPILFKPKILFDKVFANMVLAYAKDKNNLQDFFDCAFRVLKEEGTFFVCDVNKENIPLEEKYYGRTWHILEDNTYLLNFNVKETQSFSIKIPYYSLDEFKICAKKAGFKIEKVFYLEPFDAGIIKKGKKFWDRLKNKPIFFGMICKKVK